MTALKIAETSHIEVSIKHCTLSFKFQGNQLKETSCVATHVMPSLLWTYKSIEDLEIHTFVK